MYKKAATLSLAILLILCFSVPAQTPAKIAAAKSGKISIAVSELEGRGLQPGEAGTLTDALSSHLSNTGVFRVMERGKMDVILKEQGFQQSGACTDEACMVEMGQLLGVDHMVTGSIGKVGKTYSVNVRMISVATSEIVRTISRNYKGEIDGVLTEVIPQVAQEFAGAERSPAPVAAAPPVATQTRAMAPAQAPAEPVRQQQNTEVQYNPDGGGHAALWILGGAVVVGGAVAAIVVLSKKDASPAPAPAPGGTGTVDVTW